jgi:hypothetical protein
MSGSHFQKFANITNPVKVVTRLRAEVMIELINNELLFVYNKEKKEIQFVCNEKSIHT